MHSGEGKGDLKPNKEEEKKLAVLKSGGSQLGSDPCDSSHSMSIMQKTPSRREK